jgi:hypothetical protein
MILIIINKNNKISIKIVDNFLHFKVKIKEKLPKKIIVNIDGFFIFSIIVIFLYNNILTNIFFILFVMHK